ncbi:carotenoid biosynthesis protein [Candidatus Chloroploca sp. M-50]|uniref:Carotenoid biosynthesis protein n=1 Tax=Candidatus Chloroploca mongolica TaxID=2528176 RepID=A0ABS4DBZ5_9CHLR|nr:carotenoid biosynthesis protein [Candidatus Chloroploca mongolica]MBP1466958.1 carotenoid biosynthesis protein [Candidatus Chloroploca mongolica]
MLHQTTRLRKGVAALFASYLFIYPWSIALIALDRVPVWGTWMGGVLLLLQGSLMGLWLIVNFGRWGAFASLWILFLSWLVEHTGATTGFPFGAFSYTEVLQPQIFGVVPLAIPFAWLLVVTTAMGVGELILGRENRPMAEDQQVSSTKVLMAAVFALLLDVTIEPFAVHINGYWVWSGTPDDIYYGIPLSNFVAWFVTSLLLSWVLLLYRAKAARRRDAAYALDDVQRDAAQFFWPWLPVTLYLTNLTMFVLVNLSRGQEFAALVGGLIMLALAFHWALPRLARRMRETEQESGA